MSAGFVVDASVGFSWVYPGQAAPETDKLLQAVAAGEPVVASSLWYLEMANVLLMARRRRRISPARRKAALEQLNAMRFILDEEAARHAFGKISDLAEKHGLTGYDAACLEVAPRRKLPLATRDEALRNAVRRCGLKAL